MAFLQPTVFFVKIVCEDVPTGDAYLHFCSIFSNPLVQLAGELLQPFQLLLHLSVKQGVAGGRLGEHIIELGYVGYYRLLVWFGGINI